MKILLINNNCGFYGGVEQHIANTVEGLSNSKGHKCYLLYDKLTNIKVKAFSELFLDSFQVDFSEATAPEKIDSICSQIKPDVLYFHKVDSIKAFTKIIGLIPSVRMIHDHDLCCPRKHKYYLYNNHICTHKAGLRCWLDLAFIERNRSSKFGLVFSNITDKISELKRNFQFPRLLAVSDFMKSELLANGFHKDRVFILNPVIKYEGNEENQFSNENTILYAGQLIRGKGVDLLLKALKYVSTDFQAFIVGQGNALEKLKKLTKRLGLEDRVQFTGWIDNKSLKDYYLRSKVVAVPSRWPEPFGMVGLEAMKYKRPVVAFNVGGISDWLVDQETGISVSEQDIAALAAAISFLLKDTDKAKEFGVNGYNRFIDKFSFEDFLNRLEEYLIF